MPFRRRSRGRPWLRSLRILPDINWFPCLHFQLRNLATNRSAFCRRRVTGANNFQVFEVPLTNSHFVSSAERDEFNSTAKLLSQNNVCNQSSFRVSVVAVLHDQSILAVILVHQVSNLRHQPLLISSASLYTEYIQGKHGT